MKKEITKMYVYAVLKVVLAVLLYALVIYMCIQLEDELAASITCGILFGIAALIYIVSGVFTIKNGEKQIREYMRTSGYSKQQLDAEYHRAKKFGRVHVGEVHLFANASNGLYIVPLSNIEEVWVGHYGENRLKGRQGYYYLHIKTGICNNIINVYYAFQNDAEQVLEYIQDRIEVNTEEEM